MKIKCLETNQNIPIYYSYQSKFKTNLAGIQFLVSLDGEYINELILLSSLLTKTSTKYPDELSYALYLNKLYDTLFFSNYEKIGKVLQITFYVHVIKNRFVDFDLFKEAISTMYDSIVNINGIDSVMVEKEKRLYIEYLQSRNSNQQNVAVDKLFEIMFKDEAYSKHLVPTISDIEKITLDRIKNAYRELVANSHKYLFYIGDLEEDKIRLDFSLFNFVSNQEIPDITDKEQKKIGPVNIVEVNSFYSQANVIIGYRLPVWINESNYIKALVFNRMFGGFFNSLLVQIIREQCLLAYQIGSEYDPYKGVIYLTMGIDEKDYQYCLSMIDKIINDLIDGNIEEEYLTLAIESLSNEHLDSSDSLLQMIEVLSLSVNLKDQKLNWQDSLEKIKNVTMNDIKEMAQLLKLDTIVLLKEGVVHENC